VDVPRIHLSAMIAEGATSPVLTSLPRQHRPGHMGNCKI
jgi:hypothetical protein